MKEEIWKAVVGYEGKYEVSNLGRVRSYLTNSGRLSREVVRMLTPQKSTSYYHCNLQGKSKNIHTMVLEAFIGLRPTNMEACHKDNNKSNNTLYNLEWGTKSKNQQDRIRHGTTARGERHKKHKLTKEQVLQILELLQNKMPHRKIAKMFSVSRSAIDHISTGLLWGWLSNEKNV
jgi:hypothetical protein